MKLSNRSITAIQKIITGDAIDGDRSIAPYRSGPQLVKFFNEFGFDDVYPRRGGFPSRWQYVEEKLRALNDSPTMAKVIVAAVSPAEYLDSSFPVEGAVEFLNPYLELDGFKLVSSGKGHAVVSEHEPTVTVEARLHPSRGTLHEFIREQLEKCDSKLQSNDLDGAITNSRSLVEAVLFDIEGRLTLDQPKYDGDLPKLYRRVMQHLNLDPARKDISDSLRQILSGLINVVCGLAPLRNKLGDAHVQQYRPQRHHAKLAVNAAKTICDFFFDTFEYQKSKNLIEEVKGEP